MNVFLNNENIVRNIIGLIKKKSMKNLKESITKEKISGVYKIVSPTGKVYVGQSLNIWARMGITNYSSTISRKIIWSSYRAMCQRKIFYNIWL